MCCTQCSDNNNARGKSAARECRSSSTLRLLQGIAYSSSHRHAYSVIVVRYSVHHMTYTNNKERNNDFCTWIPTERYETMPPVRDQSLHSRITSILDFSHSFYVHNKFFFSGGGGFNLEVGENSKLSFVYTRYTTFREMRITFFSFFDEFVENVIVRFFNSRKWQVQLKFESLGVTLISRPLVVYSIAYSYLMHESGALQSKRLAFNEVAFFSPFFSFNFNSFMRF